MRSILAAGMILVSSITGAHADEASDKVLNASNNRMGSCEQQDVAKATDGILLFSWREEMPLCEMMKNSEGHMPEVGAFRYLLTATYLIKHDNEAEANEIAYQLLNITEARNSDSPEKMKKTFDLVYRVNHVTGGHVSPRDINIFLRSSGEMAHTLSDEGLGRMAGLIWEMKKKDGD